MKRTLCILMFLQYLLLLASVARVCPVGENLIGGDTIAVSECSSDSDTSEDDHFAASLLRFELELVVPNVHILLISMLLEMCCQSRRSNLVV